MLSFSSDLQSFLTTRTRGACAHMKESHLSKCLRSHLRYNEHINKVLLDPVWTVSGTAYNAEQQLSS